MMFLKILFIVVFIILAVKCFGKYKPKFDLVQSGTKYKLFFWYTKYDSWGDDTRTYIEVF